MVGAVHEIRRHEANSGITALNPALDGLARKCQAVERRCFAPILLLI
jgi:hypothetical protein